MNSMGRRHVRRRDSIMRDRFQRGAIHGMLPRVKMPRAHNLS